MQVPTAQEGDKEGYLPVTFEIRAGSLEPGEAVYISGSCPELGKFSFVIRT